MRIRFLHTESFRLTALYTAVFVVCVTALGASIPAVVDVAMRELIVQHSQADIAAINEGNVHEGPHEAMEVSAQLMAAVGHTDFLLLQKNGRVLAGNLPAMANRTGSFEIPNPIVPRHNILGAGARLANGLYAFSGSDLVFVTVVRARIVHLLLWLFAGAIFVAALGGFFVSRSFVARMDAIAGRVTLAGATPTCADCRFAGRLETYVTNGTLVLGSGISVTSRMIVRGPGVLATDVAASDDGTWPSVQHLHVEANGGVDVNGLRLRPTCQTYPALRLHQAVRFQRFARR